MAALLFSTRSDGAYSLRAYIMALSMNVNRVLGFFKFIEPIRLNSLQQFLSFRVYSHTLMLAIMVFLTISFCMAT